MSSNAHVPVLLGPVLEGLDIKEDGLYVDATFGRGGHSSAILQRLGSEGRIIAIDRDPAGHCISRRGAAERLAIRAVKE